MLHAHTRTRIRHACYCARHTRCSLSRCVYAAGCGKGVGPYPMARQCRSDHRSMEPLDRPDLRAPLQPPDHDYPTGVLTVLTGVLSVLTGYSELDRPDLRATDHEYRSCARVGTTARQCRKQRIRCCSATQRDATDNAYRLHLAQCRKRRIRCCNAIAPTVPRHSFL
jgi:hypothetical protein